MRFGFLIGFALTVVVASCNGSSSDFLPGTSASPVGTWGGSGDDCVDTCFGSAVFTFDADGQFTFTDPNSTYTGTYQTLSARVIQLNESGGGKGVLLVDSTMTHGGFFIELLQLQVGAVQKGANGPVGPYTITELLGTWMGPGLIPDDSYNVATSLSASVTFSQSGCSPPCADFTWTDTAGYSLTDFWAAGDIDSTYGGDYDFTNDINWFLTPDRNFLGAILCNGYPSVPSDCRIEGLARQ